MKIEIEKLKDSNEFLNVLLDNTVSAIFIVDKDVKLRSVNNSFETLFQTQEDKILGKLCGNAIGCSFVAGTDKKCGTTPFCSKCDLRKSLIHSFTERIPVFREKLERDFIVNKNIIKKIFQYTTRYITFNDNEYVLVIVDDVTEFEIQKESLKKQNQQLQELLNQNKELLGIAAHDLRNPISAAHTLASMISMQQLQPNSEMLDNYVKYIKESTQYALNLLGEILDLSTIESGKLKLYKTKSNYKYLVLNVIEINKAIATQKNIIINSNFEKIDIEPEIDEIKIQQVLNNLISNAIKYSHSETTIEIKVEINDNSFITRVIDQGQGIPNDEISKLFKPFQKTSVQATAGELSTGLGLAISKKIIEGHNGHIGVNSSVGTGSDFYFELPL